MEDVLDVYSRPRNAMHPVVCLDESPKQLVSETRHSYIDKQGVKHEDYEYVREGAADIYMVVAPLEQKREVFVADNHNGNTWAKIVAYIVEQMFPQAEKITLIEDNLSTHKRYNLYNVFEPQRARAILNTLEFVYTPKHGSWLNIAECELSVLSRQALDARFENKEKLETQVKI